MTVAEAAPSPERDEIRYSGAIEADASVDVAFRVSGVVEQVTLVKGADGRMRPLQEGDLVRRGQPLARLRQMEFSDQAADAAYDLIIYDQCVPKTMPACNTLFIGRVPPGDQPAPAAAA